MTRDAKNTPSIVDGFSIEREASIGLHKLTELAKGLEDSPPLKELFKDRAERQRFPDSVLAEVRRFHGYMWVNDENGHLMISRDYLRRADERLLYLDLVHELVHVKQYREGKELFDENYSYIERLTEIEAYKLTLKEARRLGLTDREIGEYLRVEWISESDHKKLLEVLGVKA